MMRVSPPFRNDPRSGKIWAVGFDGNETPVIDVRGWGYLTGMGHGALGLDSKEAIELQTEFGELIATLLNEHFAKTERNVDILTKRNDTCERK